MVKNNQVKFGMASMDSQNCSLWRGHPRRRRDRQDTPLGGIISGLYTINIVVDDDDDDSSDINDYDMILAHLCHRLKVGFCPHHQKIV